MRLGIGIQPNDLADMAIPV